MEKKLKKSKYEIYYFRDGERINGAHSDIRGNVSDISGDVSNISGDVLNIYGDVSGIYGDASDISGYIDSCEITDEEREKGVRIEDLLIKEE